MCLSISLDFVSSDPFRSDDPALYVLACVHVERVLLLLRVDGLPRFERFLESLVAHLADVHVRPFRE